MPREIRSEKPIPLANVRRLLEQREEEAPLNYVQRVTLEHAMRFSKPLANSETLIKSIVEKFALSERAVIQILNLDPQTPLDIETVVGEKLNNKEKLELLEIYGEAVAESERMLEDTISEKEDEEVF